MWGVAAVSFGVCRKGARNVETYVDTYLIYGARVHVLRSVLEITSAVYELRSQKDPPQGAQAASY